MQGHLRSGALAGSLIAASVGIALMAGDTLLGQDKPTRREGDAILREVIRRIEQPEAMRLKADLRELAGTYYRLGELLEDDRVMSVAGSALANIDSIPIEELNTFVEIGLDVTRPNQAALDLEHKIHLAILAAREEFRAMWARVEPPAALEDFPEASYSDICGSERTDTEVEFAAKVAWQIIKLGWVAADRGCQQTVLGTNVATACIVVDLLITAAEFVIQDIEFCDESVDAAEIKGSYERLGFMQDELVDLQSDVNVIDGKVDNLHVKVDFLEGHLTVVEAKIDALADRLEEVYFDLRVQNCEIIRLLHAPEGSRNSSIDTCSDRAEWPYIWNK